MKDAIEKMAGNLLLFIVVVNLVKCVCVADFSWYSIKILQELGLVYGCWSLLSIFSHWFSCSVSFLGDTAQCKDL